MENKIITIPALLTDFKKPRIVKFTHHYSRQKNIFFGIKTGIKTENINLICGYIQLIRELKFPNFMFLDNGICEHQIPKILNDFLNVEIITNNNHEEHEEIDLFKNWHEYACNNKKPVKQIMIKNSAKRILSIISNDMIEFHKPQKDASHLKIYEFEKEYEKIISAISNNYIEKKWNWFNCEKKHLIGTPNDLVYNL